MHKNNFLLLLLLFFASINVVSGHIFAVDNLNDSGSGSLREAIHQANALNGQDTIVFNASGALELLSPLPAIVEALMIDGVSAPGYQPLSPTVTLYSEQNLISASQPQWLLIRGLRFTGPSGFYQTGIEVLASTGHISITQCRFEALGISIKCTGDATWNIKNNLLANDQGNTALVFEAVTSGNVSAEDNLFYDPQLSNVFGAQNGIQLISCANLTIGSASVVPLPQIIIKETDGIGLVSSAIQALNCSNLIFDRLDLNRVNASSGSGIVVINGGGDMVVKNCSTQSRQNGLFCGGDANWVIVDNDTRGTENGIAIRDVINGTIEAHGNLFGGSYGGIGLRITNCQNKHIGSENSAPTPDIILRNTDGLKDCAGIALAVESCPNFLVEDLDFAYSGPNFSGQGIIASGSSGYITIRNCNLSNRIQALNCQGDLQWQVYNNDLSHSYICLNLYFIDGANFTAHHNTFSAEEVGIILYQCRNLTIGNTAGSQLRVENNEGLNLTNFNCIAAFSCENLRLEGLNLSKAPGEVFAVGAQFSDMTGTLDVLGCNFDGRSLGLACGGINTVTNVSCNLFANSETGLQLSGVNNVFEVHNNNFVNNTLGLEALDGVANAQSNYWGGVLPSNGGYNGYSGNVNAANPLFNPAGCAPNVACPDTDGDGICNASDNCPLQSNPGQEDADCDGRGNVCDVCPGGNDSMDNNQDGIPDCAQLLPYEAYHSSWKCGNNKINVCHNGTTLCINKNALAAHYNHGDKIGPCIGCSASKNAPQGDVASGSETSDLDMDFSPNPATDMLMVSLEGVETAATLTLFNVIGQTVLSLDIVAHQHSVQLSLPENQVGNGLYILALKAGQRQVIKRLLIERR